MTLSASLQSLTALRTTLGHLECELTRIDQWGDRIGSVLLRNGRLLACGNGGSAAQAQHLTAELVGRFDSERAPRSAIALHSDGAAYTAIVNDYGPERAYARQVQAHGRPGDVLVALSTSGRSPNVLAAVEAAASLGMLTLGLSGRAPTPLTQCCHDSLPVDSSDAQRIQEVHLVVVHLLCAVIEGRLAVSSSLEVDVP